MVQKTPLGSKFNAKQIVDVQQTGGTRLQSVRFPTPNQKPSSPILASIQQLFRPKETDKASPPVTLQGLDVNKQPAVNEGGIMKKVAEITLDQASATTSQNQDDASPHVMILRKDSLDESEKTTAHGKWGKPTEAIADIQPFESELPHSEKENLHSSDLLDLESVTFFCALCHRPRTYHNSVHCSICGPDSTIRYCSASCQRQDTEHWRLCGLSSFHVPTKVPGNIVTPRPGSHGSLWMTPAISRQRLHLANQKNVDYFLFNPRVNAPKHRVVFDEEKTKNQFSKLREKLFDNQDAKKVILMYRVLQSYCGEKDLNLTPQDLAGQLWSEFGVNPLISPASKDPRITWQDWTEACV